MRDESGVLKREMSGLLADVREFLGSFPRASWLTTVAATGAFVTVLVWSNFAIATSVGRFIDSLYGATGGWIAPQLVYPLCALGLMGLAFSRIGGLSWTDVGWRAPALAPAFVVVVLFWLGTQGTLWFAYEAHGGEPTWGWSWRGQEGSVLAGLNAQLLGNSLTEETLFRGLLLPQVYLRFSGMRSNVALILCEQDGPVAEQRGVLRWRARARPGPS